jgi:hypothetical protein
MGFELRASQLLLLGRCSTTWDTSPALFCFSHFSDRVSCFCRVLASDCNPPTSGSLYSWDYRHALPHLAYWLRWSLENLLPRLASNCDPPNLCLLSSWDYRHEPLHLVLLFSFYRKLSLEKLGYLSRSTQLRSGCVRTWPHVCSGTASPSYWVAFEFEDTEIRPIHTHTRMPFSQGGSPCRMIKANWFYNFTDDVEFIKKKPFQWCFLKSMIKLFYDLYYCCLFVVQGWLILTLLNMLTLYIG